MADVRLVKPADVLVVIAMVLLTYWSIAGGQNSGAAPVAIVEIDGEVTHRIDLREDGEVRLDNFNDAVVLQISQKSIAVIENNCPHQICRKSGLIARAGQMIACVPKKLLIYIPAANDKRKPVTTTTG